MRWNSGLQGLPGRYAACGDLPPGRGCSSRFPRPLTCALAGGRSPG